MPTVTSTPTTGFAFCRDARCAGYQTEEVDALREEASYTYGESGGDGIFASMQEKSMVEFRFADPDDAPCHTCGQPRDVSGEPRPVYPNESGKDPMGLLEMAGSFNPNRMVSPAESATVQLQAELADMREQMAKLLEAKE